MNQVRTPCIGICSTGIGDEVCRGCKRFAHEIVAWNAYTGEEKAAVMRRVDQLLHQVLQDKIRVVDEVRLRQELAEREIRPGFPETPSQCVQALYRAAAGDIREPAKFGLELAEEYTGLTAQAFRDRVDTELHALSQAHLERYFKS